MLNLVSGNSNVRNTWSNVTEGVESIYTFEMLRVGMRSMFPCIILADRTAVCKTALRLRDARRKENCVQSLHVMPCHDMSLR